MTKLISCYWCFKVLWSGRLSSAAMTSICFGVRQVCQQVEKALPIFSKVDAIPGLPRSSLPCECSQNGEVCTLRDYAHWAPTVCKKVHWTPAPWHCYAKNFSLNLSSCIQNNTMHSMYYDYSYLLLKDRRLAKRGSHLTPVYEARYLNTSLCACLNPTPLPLQSQ